MPSARSAVPHCLLWNLRCAQIPKLHFRVCLLLQCQRKREWKHGNLRTADTTSSCPMKKWKFVKWLFVYVDWKEDLPAGSFILYSSTDWRLASKSFFPSCLKTDSSVVNKWRQQTATHSLSSLVRWRVFPFSYWADTDWKWFFSLDVNKGVSPVKCNTNIIFIPCQHEKLTSWNKIQEVIYYTYRAWITYYYPVLRTWRRIGRCRLGGGQLNEFQCENKNITFLFRHSF